MPKKNKPNVEHPLQPLHVVNGVLRFKENAIVRKMLEITTAHGFGPNEIVEAVSEGKFPEEDRLQLNMLIGYSHSGIPNMPDLKWEAALNAYNEGISPTEAQLEVAKRELAALKRALRRPMARLFGKHPDDFEVDEAEDDEEE